MIVLKLDGWDKLSPDGFQLPDNFHHHYLNHDIADLLSGGQSLKFGLNGQVHISFGGQEAVIRERTGTTIIQKPISVFMSGQNLVICHFDVCNYSAS